MITNKQAHEQLSILGSLFEEYNKTGFLDLSPTLLEITQRTAINCFDLVKFLKSKEDCEATRAYAIFCGKILLRLSYLRHEGRKETDLETANYFKHFMREKVINETANI